MTTSKPTRPSAKGRYTSTPLILLATIAMAAGSIYGCIYCSAALASIAGVLIADRLGAYLQGLDVQAKRKLEAGSQEGV